MIAKKLYAVVKENGEILRSYFTYEEAKRQIESCSFCAPLTPQDRLHIAEYAYTTVSSPFEYDPIPEPEPLGSPDDPEDESVKWNDHFEKRLNELEKIQEDLNTFVGIHFEKLSNRIDELSGMVANYQEEPQVICPKCKEENMTSEILPNGAALTVGKVKEFWDNKHLYHCHSTHKKISKYRCSLGHTFIITEKNECPSCTWPKPQETANDMP